MGDYRKGKSETIDGVQYDTRKEACEAFNVSCSAVNKRMQRHNLSFERALKERVGQEALNLAKLLLSHKSKPRTIADQESLSYSEKRFISMKWR